MLTLVNEWKFLAGLGMFLFGLFMMEESIKRLSGRAFKVMIRRYTGSRLKGLATGILSTAILQSSSAVSLLVLAFMGAGLMTLVNAIAVIIGAKVGTTVTAIVVLLALPLILWLVHDFLDLASNAVLGVALFHTLFNVTGAVIFFPLISTMARRLEKLFP